MNTVDQPFVFPFKATTWGYVKTLLNTAPNFQIWVGNGGNGKSTLLSAVAERYPSRFIRFISPRDLLRCRFKNHVLAVDEWDDTVKIPGAVIQRLMELGNMVILLTNTYPILVNPTYAVLEQTHVIPFSKYFGDKNPNAQPMPNWSPRLDIDDAQARYIHLLGTDSSPQHVEPAECVLAKKELLLLTIHLPHPNVPAVAPSRVEWPSTGPTESTAIPGSTAPPTLKIKEEVVPKIPVDQTKMDDSSKNKIEVNKVVKNINTVESFNLGIPTPAPAPAPAPAPVLPSVVQATVEERATDDSDEEMTVPNYADISMLLVHKDRGRPDDLLTIRVDPYSDGFYVTLDQKYIGSSCTAYFNVNDLPGYLRGFFQSMQYDADGYSHVQFAAPLFPAVVVKRRYTLEYLNYQLIQQISFLLNNWPTDEQVRGPWRSGH